MPNNLTILTIAVVALAGCTSPSPVDSSGPQAQPKGHDTPRLTVGGLASAAPSTGATADSLETIAIDPNIQRFLKAWEAELPAPGSDVRSIETDTMTKIASVSSQFTGTRITAFECRLHICRLAATFDSRNKIGEIGLVYGPGKSIVPQAMGGQFVPVKQADGSWTGYLFLGRDRPLLEYVFSVTPQ